MSNWANLWAETENPRDHPDFWAVPRRSMFGLLRGSDLNRRPLGYEFRKAGVGNTLISWGKRSRIISYMVSASA